MCCFFAIFLPSSTIAAGTLSELRRGYAGLKMLSVIFHVIVQGYLITSAESMDWPSAEL